MQTSVASNYVCYSVCSDGLHYIKIKKGLLNIRLRVMSIVHTGIILSIILTKFFSINVLNCISSTFIMKFSRSFSAYVQMRDDLPCHTEQKNHWSMHETMTKFHVTRLVNQSRILPFAWMKKFWYYIGVQHTKTIIYHQKLQNHDGGREHDINVWYAKLSKE